MKEHFYQKTGIVITRLARELMQLKKGDRLPIISDYQTQLNVSRGTVQNGLQFLKDEKAIVTESRGHLGTFLSDINYDSLAQYALFDSMTGTMPLPYSRLYEGFATGLYQSFGGESLRLNMAYVRGSKDRIQSVVNGVYHFAVVSKFAAQQGIKNGAPIEQVIDFGPYTYLSRHILLFREAHKESIEENMCVGIDNSSYDQQRLTQEIVKNKKVTFKDMPGHQLIYALKEGEIDAGIWNYDEIIDKNYQDLNYVLLKENQMQVDMSTAVLVCLKEDSLFKTIIKKNIDKQNLLETQKKVLEGTLIPRY